MGLFDTLKSIGRGLVDGTAEIISNGADEMAQALFTQGSGYTGAEWTPPEPDVAGYSERLIIDSAPVEAAPVEAPVIDSPQSGWGEQAPMGFPEVGFSDNATIIDMQPQIDGGYEARLAEAASRVPQISEDLGMER